MREKTRLWFYDVNEEVSFGVMKNGGFVDVCGLCCYVEERDGM